MGVQDVDQDKSDIALSRDVTLPLDQTHSGVRGLSIDPTGDCEDVDQVMDWSAHESHHIIIAWHTICFKLHELSNECDWVLVDIESS